MNLVVGIDPGLTGALALLDEHGTLLEVGDMPVVDHQVNAALLHGILDDWRAVVYEYPCVNTLTVVTELVGPMPKQGVTSVFSFGVSYGTILGVVGARWPLHRVRPAVWKRAMGLTADKDACRQRAIDLWPAKADQFKRKKDDGRAEAALLGLYLIEKGRKGSDADFR